MLFFEISGQEERNLFFIGMIYESIVLGIALILLALIILKYLEKRHELTYYLVIAFLFYTFAILFSLIAKIFVVLKLDLVVEPYSPLGLVFFRILSFRVSEFLVVIAIFISYIFKVKIFQKDYNRIQKYIVIIFGSFTAFYDLVIYEPNPSFLAVLLDAIAFLLTLIFMSMIYFAFLYRSIEAYRGVKEPIYKKAFLSLAIMAISFILIFLNFLIDRIFILVLEIPGFTIFYYLAWAFTIVGIVSAYFGYIRPEAGKTQ
ncbi:MAG: hypothetical protein EU539_08370 [Promethearchaeota archaeon]|nr:MAG: hypothetical protein EU539_08370 [Candidatus Lokiarchaeota archaeon]